MSWTTSTLLITEERAMEHRKLDGLQWYVVALAALFAIAMLAWEYTHGGVVSHHFLDRRDMPAVSNWWSLAVLPLLAGLPHGPHSAEPPWMPARFRRRLREPLAP